MKLQTRWTLIAASAFLLDRLLKHLALSGAHAGGDNGLLRFALFRNDGIAFSLPFSGPLVWLLSIGILAFIGRLAYKDFRTKHYKRAEAYLFFVLGACSNLFDRIVYGFTVDYAIFFRLSAVNIADAMIIAGAAWLVLKAPGKK
ncbi:MAG: signal peptidase II [Patescibacteria group bacterium]|jgi:signal peptidase II